MSEDSNTNETPKSKADLFAENPDRFIDQQDVILMVRRHPETHQLGMLIRIAETLKDFNEDATTLDVYEEALKIQGYTHRKLGSFISLIEQTVAQRNAATSLVPAKGGKNPNFLQSLRNGKHRR